MCQSAPSSLSHRVRKTFFTLPRVRPYNDARQARASVTIGGWWRSRVFSERDKGSKEKWQEEAKRSISLREERLNYSPGPLVIRSSSGRERERERKDFTPLVTVSVSPSLSLFSLSLFPSLSSCSCVTSLINCITRKTTVIRLCTQCAFFAFTSLSFSPLPRTNSRAKLFKCNLISVSQLKG